MKKLLWFSLILIAAGIPPANGEKAVSNDHEATAKLGCAKISEASFNLGWASGGGALVEPPIMVVVPRVAAVAERVENGGTEIRVGSVRRTEGLSKGQINKLKNELLEGWSGRNAVSVYSVETVNCFVAGIGRLQSEQEILAKSIVSRQDRAEAAIRQLNRESSIELLARIDQLQRRLAEMQKLIEASQPRL